MRDALVDLCRGPEDDAIRVLGLGPGQAADVRRNAGLAWSPSAPAEKVYSGVLYEALGLRTMYLGDEAIIEVQKFSLQGRPIRKVRQSVHRLTKAGFRTELHRVGDLPAPMLAEI